MLLTVIGEYNRVLGDPFTPVLLLGIIVTVVWQLRRLRHVQLSPLEPAPDSVFPELRGINPTPLPTESDSGKRAENSMGLRFFSLAFILLLTVLLFKPAAVNAPVIPETQQVYSADDFHYALNPVYHWDSWHSFSTTSAVFRPGTPQRAPGF